MGLSHHSGLSLYDDDFIHQRLTSDATYQRLADK